MNSTTDRQTDGALAEALRVLRQRTGLSGKEFAGQLGWQPSKVSRLELGRQMPSAADVETWIAACSPSMQEAAELRRLFEDAAAWHRDWRRRMRHGQANVQADYNELVASSAIVRHYEVAWVPGLLQTPAYARHVLAESASLHDVPAQGVDAAVAARLARQQHLYDPGKRFEFLICEPVLRWRTCPGDVLLAQLDRLTTAADLSNVRLGIVPLDTPIGLTPQNAFQVYGAIAVVETFVGETFYEEPDSSAYIRIMERLWNDAAIGEEASRLIRRAMDALR